jgi:hypothetical protein
LINRLGSDNLALDQINGSAPPPHGVDVRSNYLFNSTIPGVEEADAILLVGTNPRHEAAVLNSRIRKSWLHTGLEVGLIGKRADTAYGYDYLGADSNALADFIAGKGAFAAKFKAAKRPLIIVGSALAEQPDGAAAYNALAKFVEKNKDSLITPQWNGFSVLHRVSFGFNLLSFSRTNLLFRLPLDLRHMKLALFPQRRPPAPNPNLSTCLTQTKSTPSLYLRMLSLFTKAITETLAPRLLMFACLPQHTLKSYDMGEHGGTVSNICSIAATSFKYFIPCHNIIHRSNPFLPSCHPSSTKCRRTFRRNSNLQKMLDVGSKMAPLLMALLRQWSHRQWTSCYRFQWALSNLVFS